MMLNFFIVNASADSLHSLDNNSDCHGSAPFTAPLAIKKGTIETPKHILKKAQHFLRMRLMNQKRSPSLAPPQGQKRHQLEEQLATIDTKLSHSH